MVPYAEPKILWVLLFINMYQILNVAGFFIPFYTQILKIRENIHLAKAKICFLF